MAEAVREGAGRKNKEFTENLFGAMKKTVLSRRKRLLCVRMRLLLNTYQAEIFLPACNSHFQSLHCIAHLNEDVGQVIPYLNAVLGGDTYIKDPPSVTFTMHGKLVTVHRRKIAINALRDEAEAHSILESLRRKK